MIKLNDKQQRWEKMAPFFAVAGDSRWSMASWVLGLLLGIAAVAPVGASGSSMLSPPGRAAGVVA
jgi:hypothetical protein